MRVLANISAGNESQIQSVIDAGAIPYFLLALAHKEKDIRVCSSLAISNVMAGTRKQLQAAIDVGVVPLICSIAHNDEEANDGIGVICSCLSTTDEKVVTLIFQAIIAVEKAMGESKQEEYAGMLKNAGAEAQLESRPGKLQDPFNAESALKLRNRYAPITVLSKPQTDSDLEESTH